MPDVNAQSKFHRIMSLRVTGGFLDGLQLNFSDGLNCIIGGRGTGKTSVLELMRWTLDLIPEDDKTQRFKTISKLIQANLGSGVVELRIGTEHGINYCVQRSWGSETIVQNESGEVVDINISQGNVLSFDVYSQNQIEDIANNPFFQLVLLDKFVSEKVKDAKSQIQSLVHDLDSNASEILKLRQETSELREQNTQLPAIVEKLKAFKIDGSDEEAKAIRREGEFKTIRDQEKRCLDQLEKLLSGTESRLRETTSQLPSQKDELFDLAIMEGPNKTQIQKVKDLADAGIRDIASLVEKAVKRAIETESEISLLATEFKALHGQQEKAYQAFLSESKKEQGKVKERDALLSRQAELQECQKKLRKRSEELAKKDAERTEILGRLSEIKDERFQVRSEMATDLSGRLNPTIRLKVEQYGNVDSYRALLLEAMKGSGFRYAQIVDKLVKRIPPQEFAAIVQRSDVETLREQLELDADRANRVILQLKDTPELFKIEVVELHDRPTVELKDGPDYKDSTALSTGQKCTTILPILLLESASPLLIDQPEDNLDNAFIFETIVKSIRKVSGNRQLILVTHNPNIPVLGEAEQVFVLSSTGRHSSLKASGSVDEVKEEVETILEGGKEAFQKRKERYGY